MNIWDTLSKPFFVLAPMDDVTDTVFRQMVAGCAKPDLFFTEFVNAEALQSKGREPTLKRLKFTDTERPIIAQIWGKNPENFYKTAQDLVGMGFDGIDINFGCPDKSVVRNGACSAFILPENRTRAAEITQASQEGANAAFRQKTRNIDDRQKNEFFPISVKTRLGFNEVDLTWHELLLKQKIDALTIHGRTKAQMSKTPADWGKIGEIRELRDHIAPATKIIGNGDVLTRGHGEELAETYGVDGIMIGRGIFNNPFVFSESGSVKWEGYPKADKIKLYKSHVELFAYTWKPGERAMQTLNKFCKIYINGFEGAKELREQLMSAQTSEELVKILTAT